VIFLFFPIFYFFKICESQNPKPVQALRHGAPLGQLQILTAVCDAVPGRNRGDSDFNRVSGLQTPFCSQVSAKRLTHKLT
jgi:hypothetical protein